AQGRRPIEGEGRQDCKIHEGDTQTQARILIMSDEQNFYQNMDAIKAEFREKATDVDLQNVIAEARAEQQRRKPSLTDPAVLAQRHAANDAEMRKMAGMNPAEYAEYQRKTYGF